MSATEKVLVVGPAWVGDMIMAQSLYKFLKLEQRPVRIEVLAPDWSLPLLARMPEVNDVVRMPLGHGQLGLGARYRLGRALRARRYDRAIILPRSAKAALVPFFAGARRRTGYKGEMRFGLLNDIRHLDSQRMPMVVQRYVALGQSADLPVPPPNVPSPSLCIDPENRERLIERFALDPGRPAIALAPGAEFGPAKRWPAAAYGELASKLVRRGFQVWLVGSEKDLPVAREVVDSIGDTLRNFCGKTSLVDAVDLLSMATAVISNDSGLMHVAAAVGVPVVAIYGSSSPRYTPPLTRERSIVYLEPSCGPCFKRECPHGVARCLTEINVEQVMGALDNLLNDR